MNNLASFLSFFLFILVLTGCGQKGPLRRPEQVSLAPPQLDLIVNRRLS